MGGRCIDRSSSGGWARGVSYPFTSKWLMSSTLSAREYAQCPSGKRALGGGVVQSDTAPDRLSVQASGPLDASGVLSQTKDGDVAKQWYAAVYNGRRTMQDFKVLAICE